jgi:hypothetical protein
MDFVGNCEFKWHHMITELLGNLGLLPEENKRATPQILDIFRKLEPHQIYKNLIYMDTCSSIGQFAQDYQRRLVDAIRKSENLALLLQTVTSREYESNSLLTAEEKKLLQEELSTEMLVLNHLVERSPKLVDWNDRLRYRRDISNSSPAPILIWVPVKKSAMVQIHCLRLPQLISLLLTGKLDSQMESQVYSRFPVETKLVRAHLESL